MESNGGDAIFASAALEGVVISRHASGWVSVWSDSVGSEQELLELEGHNDSVNPRGMAPSGGMGHKHGLAGRHPQRALRHCFWAGGDGGEAFQRVKRWEHPGVDGGDMGGGNERGGIQRE